MYLRRSQFLVATSSRTENGFWITIPPYSKLPEDVSPRELGAAVDAALRRSESGIPSLPKNDKSIRKALLDAAGVKSYSDFVDGCLLVHVVLRNQRLTLTPMLNRGAREGFNYPNESSDLNVTPGDPGVLGEKIIEAMKLAE